LKEVANELSNRLIRLWLRDKNGERPYERGQGAAVSSPQLTKEADSRPPRLEKRHLFYEYFHADTGAGLGASHQTGWTGLVAKLIQQQGEFGTITDA
jgi:hypothetical protein